MMAFVSAVTGDDSTKKFMEVLQSDFKTLSLETKKKYPQIREACDEAIEKLSLASNNPQASLYGVVNQILYPLVQGCESKDLKIIKFCLGTVQRLIAQQGIDAKGARHVVDCLYNLGQAGVLELKLLQTAALLMTTSDLVHGDTLARTMVMCMRMVSVSESRDVSTSHAAAATVRQLVALVFERALAEADGKDPEVQTMVMCMRMVSVSESRDVSTSHAAAATVRQLVALVFERALAEADGKDPEVQTMVMCMRMVSVSESRDVSTSHAAAATVRQLVALVFERALAEADGKDPEVQTMVMCMRMVSVSESRDVSTSHAAAATVRQLVALVFERALAEADGKDPEVQTMVMCMRMVSVSESRDVSTSHAAAATVRQLVALVFERALAEADGTLKVNPADIRPQTNNKAPKDLKPCAVDAYLILQDIIQLVNGDSAHWLVGISDVPKTFGLELLDTVLTDFSPVFFKIAEFRFLLKEHVCALIIRLFSPNVKYRAAFTALHIPGAGAAGSAASPAAPERPHFPVTMRLLRLVSIIVHKYHAVLVTECEIFLSLTIKFLDPDKPMWQRALALEVLHKMTIQPNLLKAFCECYDMKPHATNIFQDIVNALGAYVQSLFVASNVNTAAGSSGIPQQSGFYWKGVWLPLCVTFEPGTAKSVYIEMLDRTEAPTIQDGYGISVAYACLMEIIRSIAISIEGAEYFRLQEMYEDIQNDTEEREVNSNKNGSNKDPESKTDKLITNNSHNGEADQNSNVVQKIEDDVQDKEKQLRLQLLKSSWCGLVWGLSVLAEASIGELENILRAIQTLARVSGKVGHSVGRDACVSALCRCALPAQYVVPALGALGALPCPWRREPPPPPDPDYRHQVVWVGTPLPSASLPTGQQQSFVMVTSRHVTAMKALLCAAQRDGDTIQQAWLPVLTTLQHLVWILGLKPSTGGSMKASRASADANAVMSTSAVMADLPGQQVPVAESLGVMSALSAMLSRVFESSKNLDDVALHHLIDALCKLSNEAMELAYSNREPSLFAVAKLLETGLANMHRIEVMWRPITNHLLEVCQHPHIRMREWGVEAITYLVQAAFQYHHNNPVLVTEARERLLLEPLSELCAVRQCDVRARQLECAARLLHSRGDQLGAAWPLMMEIISAISSHHSEQLIRSAFQCAQVVAGDLLGCAGPRCLRQVLAAAAAFATQTKELNISLTAVGLMWNISDYLYHNRDKLVLALASDAAVCPEVPNHAELPPLDKLWMCLYIRLSELCTEARAPVRRAASQTLFSCIGAHGTLLSKPAWRALLAVLFPMLEEVQKQSNIASSEKVDTGEHILIHHTRNTAQKQWAETQVLTLSGVSRVFHSRFQLLTTVGDFNRSWTALLDYITDFALRRSHEVSVGALKSFQEVVSAAGRATDVDPALMRRVWAAAWAAWTNIAASSHSDPPPSEDGKPVEVYAPSQNFLTTLVQIFPLIFQHIRPTFTAADVTQLGSCLSHVCSTEPSAAASALDSLAAAAPVSLHALHCLDIVHKEALQRHELLASLFGALTSLAASCSERAGGAAPRCLAAAAALYRAAPAAASHVLPHLLLALHSSVLKYGQDKRRKTAEQMEETAQISSLLLQVLSTGLPLAREQPDEYKEFWETLPRVLETFLFEPPVGGGRAARQLVIALREQALRAKPRLPPQHARALLALVRAGSLHTQPPLPIQNEQELKEREEFARTCFETLLQYSMLEDIDSFAGVENDTDPLAIVALLDRFQEVISKYTQDEDNTEPLPRHQLSEISFVLKAVATLTESMKKAPPGKVDAVAWHKLIGVYPSLARLAASARAAGAGAALREALLPFGALLAAPL